MIKPQDATHYSKSRNEYFHFDGCAFVWNDNYGWIEYIEIGRISDLIEVKTPSI